MRIFHLLILLGVGLLLGFTFLDNTPGRHAGEGYTPSVAPVAASTDLVRNAFQAARRPVEARLADFAPTFPGRGEYRRQVTRQADGTFVIKSWVRTTERYGISAQRPWTARVRCTGLSCDVLDYNLQR